MKLVLVTLLAATAVMAKEVCVPRAVVNTDCNVCVCSDDGNSYGCTDMMCDGKTDESALALNALNTEHPPEQVCRAGAHFFKYCNVCACARDGSSYICTKMACDEATWNEDGTRKKQ